MELIPATNTNITSTQNKILETIDSFIINTQFYDKSTLKPIPLKFYAGLNLNLNLLLIKNRIDWPHISNGTSFMPVYCHKVHTDMDMLIQDKTDVNRFYIQARYYLYFGDSYSTYGDNIYLFRAQVINNEMNIVNAINTYNHYGINYDSDAINRRKNDLKILYETTNYFIAQRKAQHYNSYYNRNTSSPYSDSFYYSYYTYDQLLRINKNSLASYTIVEEYNRNVSPFNSSSTSNTAAYNYGQYSPCSAQRYFMEQREEMGYILTRGRDYIRVSKYDAINNVHKGLYASGAFSSSIHIACNSIKIGDYHYTLTHDGAGAYCLLKITIAEDDTITTEVLPVDSSKFTGTYDTYFIPKTLHAELVHSLNTFTINNVTYLTCTIHSTPNYVWQKECHCHATFRLESDKLVLVDIFKLTDGCVGVTYYLDARTCIFFMTNCYAFYAFDDVTEKYIKTYTRPGIFNSMGFDMLDRFFAQTTDGAVDILTYSSPVILKADFAEEIYDKETEDINTTVSFYAKNFLNQYINTNVTLTLIGNAVFTDSDSKTISLTTLNTGVATVPVTIKGHGKIEVVISQTT